jgi:hypothetical protein
MVTEPEHHGTYKIACEDCGVVKVYHTPIGIRYFEDMHFGHRITLKEEAEPEVAVADVNENIATTVLEPPQRVISVNAKRVDAEARSPELEAVAEQEKIVENLQKLLEQHDKSEQVAPPAAIPAEVSVVQVDETAQESKEEPTVLLGKYAFIKEGEKYRQEAVRISQALKEFRWKIEPPYVISILFDDSLGIQSTTGTISRELLAKVEQLGYQFVAVEAPEGVPTAWFRKGVVAANVDLS